MKKQKIQANATVSTHMSEVPPLAKISLHMNEEMELYM